MSEEVKCMLCNEPFKSKETLKLHFVDEHSITTNDAILDRHVKLRFSKTEFDPKTFDTMMKLLKVLKQNTAKYTLQRDKVKLDSNKIIF